MAIIFISLGKKFAGLLLAPTKPAMLLGEVAWHCLKPPPPAGAQLLSLWAEGCEGGSCVWVGVFCYRLELPSSACNFPSEFATAALSVFPPVL